MTTASHRSRRYYHSYKVHRNHQHQHSQYYHHNRSPLLQRIAVATTPITTMAAAFSVKQYRRARVQTQPEQHTEQQFTAAYAPPRDRTVRFAPALVTICTGTFSFSDIDPIHAYAARRWRSVYVDGPRLQDLHRERRTWQLRCVTLLEALESDCCQNPGRNEPLCLADPEHPHMEPDVGNLFCPACGFRADWSALESESESEEDTVDGLLWDRSCESESESADDELLWDRSCESESKSADDADFWDRT